MNLNLTLAVSKRGNGVWFLSVSNATNWTTHGLCSRTNVAVEILAFGCCGGGDSCSLMLMGVLNEIVWTSLMTCMGLWLGMLFKVSFRKLKLKKKKKKQIEIDTV
jgi:hypothetical protein